VLTLREKNGFKSMHFSSVLLIFSLLVSQPLQEQEQTKGLGGITHSKGFGRSIAHVPGADGGSLLIGCPTEGKGGTGAILRISMTGSVLGVIREGEGRAFGFDMDVSMPSKRAANGELLISAPMGGMKGTGQVCVLDPNQGKVRMRVDSLADESWFGVSCIWLADLDKDGFDDFLVRTRVKLEGKENTQDAFVVLSGKDGKRLWTFRSLTESYLSEARPLALIGDSDGDGIQDFAIAGDGKCWVIGSRKLTALFVVADQEHQDDSSFGYSMCSIPDIDGDGITDLVIGDPQLEEGGSPGELTLASGANGATILKIQGDQPAGGFAFCLARTSDFDGDGKEDLLVASNCPIGTSRITAYGSASKRVIHKLDWPDPSVALGWRLAAVRDRSGHLNDKVFASCYVSDQFELSDALPGQAVILFDTHSWKQLLNVDAGNR
jgi:hypothetical protein